MSIREISAAAITDAVEALCIEANTQLPADVKAALDKAEANEPWPLAKETLGLLQQNLCVAADKDLPICQDTGMACVFIELGQDAHINGDLTDAVNEGVRRGYEKAYLRKSITADPLQRVNTGDNTPAFLTVHLVPGSGCKITVAPKGAGSENMSRLAMLKPADGVEGVKKFVLDTVEQAGANPCPPVVLGIGIGGSFDHCAALAKKALLRPLDTPNADPYYAALEKELLDALADMIQEQLDTTLGQYSLGLENLTKEAEEQKNIQAKIASRKQEIQQLRTYQRGLYEGLIQNHLSKDEYFTFKEKYEAKIEAISEEIEQLKAGLAIITKQLEQYKMLSQDAQHIKEDCQLTAALIDRLIDRVEVSREKRITVRFRFQSEFEHCEEVLSQCRNM